jgi:hypothetical protein
MNHSGSLAFLALLLFSSGSVCVAQDASAPQFQFRKTNWGMSREAVKRSEAEKPYKEEGSTISYFTTVAGKRTLLVYTFTSCCLAEAQYAHLGEHTNKNEYIDDYESLKRRMAEKYGAPDSDDVEWKNDLFKDRPQDYGLAVSVGLLEYEAEWQTKTTDIDLHLFGDNYQIDLFTNYRSKIFGPALVQQLRDKQKDEF